MPEDLRKRPAAPALAWRLLRSEGPAALLARLADHRAEARRRRGFAALPAPLQAAGSFPVLQLAALPPLAWYGGTQTQLRRRLGEEAATRPVALLHAEGDGFRLELERDGRRCAGPLPGPAGEPLALTGPRLAALIGELAPRLGARALHVEGLAGLPVATLAALAAAGLEVILSLHDFAAFCARPHLLEQPVERFCGYSRDLARCGRCLAADWPLDGAWQAERRRAAAGLLERAAGLVFPSPFLQRAHHELFPAVAAVPQWVVPPGAGTMPAAGSPAPRREGPVRHVALVGGVKALKGARIFGELVRDLRGELPQLRWSAFGSGDPAPLAELAEAGVACSGYYRSGALAERLRRARVDLALLLSIVPESYSLVLDECAAAGVPVVAFAHGALAERVPALAAGWLVAPERGAAGVAELVREAVAGGLGRLPPRSPAAPAPESAAASYFAIYRQLGLA